VTGLPARRGLLCLVTHGDRLVSQSGADADTTADRLVSQVREAAAAGVDLVQVRESSLQARDLCRLVERCVAAAAGSLTRIVVNDRADVALAAGAHGVHLRADSFPAGRVRAIAPPGFVVGRSVHAADEAADAAREGAVDYIVFGTVFATLSKRPDQRVAGIAGLAAAVAAARPVPVLAIGGVSAETVPALRAAGAAGLAAIGLFLPGSAGGGPTLVETVQRLRQAFDTPADLVRE
jgi:thiamine-phosphate pyrophosphorylase